MSRLGRSLGPSVPATALLVHCASWFALLAHGHLWIGAWIKAVEEVAGSVIIVGPVLAGLTANLYARRGETVVPALVVSSAHPLRGWYAPAVRLWLVAAASLLVVLGEVAVLVALAGPPLGLRPLLVVPLCLVVLALHVLVGMVIGLVLGPRIAGAVAGTCSFALFLLAVANLAPAVFVTGGVTGDLAGVRYRTSYLLAAGGIAALTALAVVAASGWSPRWLRTRLALSLALGAAAMALSNADVAADDRRFEVREVALHCRGASPEVCLPADVPRSLAAAARGMERLAVPLRRAGVRLPPRWVYSWGQPRVFGEGVLSMSSGTVLGGRLRAEDLVRSLTMPAWCSGYDDDVAPQQALNVRLLLEHWITFRNGLGRGHTSVHRGWFSSPESEAWVRSTYAKLRSCDLDALHFPARQR